MTKFERNLSLFLLTLSSTLLGCTDDGGEPADDEAAESEGSCTPGEQGCECYLGFCEPGFECVDNLCVDPNCLPGSEACNCAEGDQCFSGLECIDGLCYPASDETSDGSTTDASTTTDGSTTDGPTTDDSSTDDSSTDGPTTDDCSPNAYTQCVDGSVVWFDSCDGMGDVLETCDGGQECVNVSASAAECQDLPPDCDCMDGPCCDGCNFRGSDYLCESDAETEYGCPNGSDPGDDVASRTRDQYCSGNSASCSGAFGSWSGWSVIDACSENEYCTPGDSSCNACTFDVTQYECSTFSPAGGNGSGGGEIFRICATTDQQGFMTVKARKLDNSAFSSRPYQVRVSAPGDDPCGPVTNYFVISDSDPVGIGTNELTFSFPSQWLAGQTQKAYCVTASTKVGDPGYDANNPQQQSWWYSKKSILVKQCG